MKKLIVLVGNVGSGKSTLAKEYASKEGYRVVSRDALRYMVGAGEYTFDPELEPAIWKAEKEILNALMYRDVNVLVDEVGINRAMRNEYLLLTDYHRYISTAIVLPRISREEAINRKMKVPHGQPDKELWGSIYDKFQAQYEEPTQKEGFDRVIWMT